MDDDTGAVFSLFSAAGDASESLLPVHSSGDEYTWLSYTKNGPSDKKPMGEDIALPTKGEDAKSAGEPLKTFGAPLEDDKPPLKTFGHPLEDKPPEDKPPLKTFGAPLEDKSPEDKPPLKTFGAPLEDKPDLKTFAHK